MIDAQRFGNQSGIVDPIELIQKRFVIVGAGAIGSFFTMTLAKMGASDITVFDMDKIEEKNIANQMYPEEHAKLETPKVEALSKVVKDFSGMEIKTVNARWSPGATPGCDFVISCVDNMDVRKEIYDHFKGLGVIFIDGRMGAQVMRAYAVDTKSDEEKEIYEKTLYPQSKAAPERCTEKSIIYTVLMVAGIMLNMVKKKLNNQPCPVEVIYDCVNEIQYTTNIKKRQEAVV